MTSMTTPRTALVCSVSLLLGAVASAAPAQGPRPHLLRDVERTGIGTVNPGSAATPLGVTPGTGRVQDTMWYRAETTDTGAELYRQDGPTAPVLPVLPELTPGPQPSDPVLMDPGPPPVFAGFSPATGTELWRLDGQGRLQLVTPEAVAGGLGAKYSRPVAMGGASYCVRIDDDHNARVELVRVAGGTVTVIASLPYSSAHGRPIEVDLTRDAGGLLHVALTLYDFDLDERIGLHYVSDCTEVGTRALAERWERLEFGQVASSHFAGDDGNGAGNELWRFGANASTLVRDLNPNGDADPREFSLLGNFTYFVATDGPTGDELWRSDGTAAGTSRVADLKPGTAGSAPSYLTVFAGKLWFAADDGTHGCELFAYDPGSNTVTLQLDVRPGAQGADPRSLTTGLGFLWFTADDGARGRELWRSDGTPGGTALVVDLFPGPGSAEPAITSSGFFGSQLMLRANDGVTGDELHRTDGTAAGTARVADLSPAVQRTEGADPRDFFDAGWDTIFVATERFAGGTELYRMTFNGDGPNAARIKDIRPGSSSSEPRDFVSLPDGRVLFTANGPGGREVWVTDGTEAGTVRVKDIRPGSQGSEPYGLRWIPGLRAVLFAADDGVHGVEPWVSDGTDAGTVLLADINPGAVGSDAALFTVRRDGAVFFRAEDGTNGSEPWLLAHGSRTPTLLADLQPTGSSFPTGFAFVDDGQGRETASFFASTTAFSSALCRSDGTTAGTTQVRSFRSVLPSSGVVGFVDARVYFVAESGVEGLTLWKSDLTAGGTVPVPGLPFGSIPQELTPLVESFQAGTSKLCFSANTALGRELCTMGPHPAHGLVVHDLNPGTASSNPRNLSLRHGVFPELSFAADGGDGTGHEPWVSFGGRPRPERVADLNRTPGVGSEPSRLTPTAYGWILSADDGIHGREVFVFSALAGVVLRVNAPCGDAQATLDATPPRLGSDLTLMGRAAPGSSLHILFLNVPAPGVNHNLLGCGFSFDLLTSLFLPAPIAAPEWSMVLRLPGDPSLAGQQFMFRLGSVRVTDGAFNFSNGLRIVPR
jgi:ELWxxDGT repeat protein